MQIKQSTARNRMVLMIDSADHITGKASLTLTITASKNGAGFNSISPTVTERGNGWYSLALTTSHTDTLGDFALHITSSGADPTDIVDEVTTAVDANIAQVLGTAITEGAAGRAAGSLSAFLNVASPVLTCASVNQTGDGFARLGAPAGASIAADLDAVPTATENADALLKRDWTAVTGEAARSALNAMRFLRNKWAVASGVLTVYKEDGTTAAWQGNVGSSAGADPITGNTPT